jgi:hypothetical protein
MFEFDAVGRLLHRVPRMWALLRLPLLEERAMQMVTTIRLDIAKSVFQVHRVDAAGWGAILAKTGMTDAYD